MTRSTCRICGNAQSNRTHHAREMMFGTREPFTYTECAACGTVQLEDQPADMSRHYPPDYYSGAQPSAAAGRRLRKLRTKVALRAPRSVATLPKIRPGTQPMWFHGHATTSSRVLDVGCGSGHNLLALWQAGFDDLVGYDPFFAAAAGAPFEVYREKQDWFSGHFDVVMMHHALEHVPDPATQLAELETMLAPGGKVLIRVPLADSWAWRHYGVNWVQLDPPRHFWLLTDQSFDLIAEKAGFRVVDRWRDSTAFQFWGSELFAADQPLQGASPPADMAEWTATSEELNRSGEGDQGGFWLQRAWETAQ